MLSAKKVLEKVNFNYHKNHIYKIGSLRVVEKSEKYKWEGVK